jgi:hypothetical protein
VRGYTCRCCGEYHLELPLHYVSPAPDAWFAVPEEERPARCLLSSDQCIIDDRRFFMVGNLEIPILGSDERFSWDVWVELSPQDFDRACELWEQEGRETEPPYPCRLATSLPGYPETIHLGAEVHTRSVGCRPLIELNPTDHPLLVEQRQGITWQRVQEIAELVLHPA